MEELFKVGMYLSVFDQATRPLSEVARKLAEFEDRVRRVSEELRRFSARYTGMGLEVMGAGLGLTAAFAAPVRSAMSFQEAMADVQKVANFTGKEYREFSARILELSRRIPLAAEELTALAAAGAQMGIAKKDLLGFTETVAKLATAFDMPAARIGDVMGKLANVFNIPISRIGELGDAVNELSNNMAASAPGIIEVLSRIGGTAAQVGLTAQQAAALSAAMLALGETPERAATALNDMLNTLSTLSVQPRKVREAVEALGLSAEDLEREIREKPIPTLMKFFEALRQSGEAAKYMNLIFGIEPGPKLVKLIQNTKELEKALGIVGDKARYAGSAEKEFQTRSATLANQLATLRNTIRSIFISLGNVWIPPLTALVKVLQGFSAWLGDFTEKHRLLAGAVVGLAGVFGVLLTVVGGGLFLLGLFARGVASGLEVLLEMRRALTLVSGRFSLFWEAIRARGGLLNWLNLQLFEIKRRFLELTAPVRLAVLRTWEWIAAQATALRMAIAQAGGLRALSAAYLGRLIAGIRTAVAAVWSFNAALLANPLTWVAGAVVALVGALYLLERRFHLFSRAISFARGLVTEFFSGLKDGIALVFSGTGVIEALRSAWYELGEAFADVRLAFRYLWEAVSGPFEALFGFLGRAGEALGIFHRTANQAGIASHNLGMSLGELLGKFLVWPIRVFARILLYTAKVLGFVFQAVLSLGDALGKLARAVTWPLRNWRKLLQLFLGTNPITAPIMALNKLVEYVSGLSLFEAGRKILLTLVEGLKSVALEPVKAVKAVVEKIRGLLPFSPARWGPLADLDLAGRRLLETVAAGVSPGALVSRVSAALSEVRGLLSNPIEVGLSVSRSLAAPALSAITAPIRWMTEAVKPPGVPDLVGKVKWIAETIRLPQISEITAPIRWLTEGVPENDQMIIFGRGGERRTPAPAPARTATGLPPINVHLTVRQEIRAPGAEPETLRETLALSARHFEEAVYRALLRVLERNRRLSFSGEV